MFDILLASIREKVALTSDQGELLKKYFIPKKYRKRQYLLNAGDRSQYIAFIEKGMMRSFTVDEKGNEHVIQFGIEKWWIADMASFLCTDDATYNIEAIEDSEVLLLSKAAMEEMIEAIPQIERYF